MISSRSYFRFLAILAVLVPCFSGPSFARDAAFLSPGASGAGVGEEAIKVDPKADIDIGETAISVAKRATIFFVNQTNVPVRIERVSISSDSFVLAEEVANDCTKQGSIAPLSRCSIEVSVTPSGAGTWSVDVLMTHNGAGRITRARLLGKTTGSGGGEGKKQGLALSSSDVKGVDFGSVEVGSGKIVRSALMINDSVDPITITSIDVIEPGNGLQRLDQGCVIGMELPAGASCPVTLLWEPKDNAPVSTDLIIKHNGKLGFAVVPIRGEAKSGGMAGEGGMRLPKGAVPLPPSAQDLEREVRGKIAPVATTSLGGGETSTAPKSVPTGEGKVTLIGTIGTRAILLLPSGETSVVATGSSFEMRDGQNGVGRLVSVGAHSAEIVVGSKRISLPLEAASSLVSMAIEQAKQDASSQKKSGSGGSGKK